MRARIGLLGCGTVGRGFVELVGRERERIRARSGVELEIAKILVRDAGKARLRRKAVSPQASDFSR